MEIELYRCEQNHFEWGCYWQCVNDSHSCKCGKGDMAIFFSISMIASRSDFHTPGNLMDSARAVGYCSI